MSDTILRAEELTKKYGQQTALDHLNVEIPRGSLFGLLGPNGAGKTTFIRLINQILVPTQGQMKIHGSIAALLELASGFDGGNVEVV